MKQDSMAGKKRLKGRQQKMKADKTSRQEKTQRQARKDSKAGKKRLNAVKKRLTRRQGRLEGKK